MTNPDAGRTDTPEVDAFTTRLYNESMAAASGLPGYGGAETSPEDAFGQAVDLAKRLEKEREQAREALHKIADFTTGYDDVAGIVNKIARAALSGRKEGA